MCPSDDETVFYDCEEGDNIHLKFSKFAATIGENSYADLPLWVTDSNSGGSGSSTARAAESGAAAANAVDNSLLRKGRVDASLLDIQGFQSLSINYFPAIAAKIQKSSKRYFHLCFSQDSIIPPTPAEGRIFYTVNPPAEILR